MGQVPRLARSNVSKKLDQSTHGNVVGENFVGVNQLSQSRSKSCMSADDSSHQAFNSKVIQSLSFAIPLACRIC